MAPAVVHFGRNVSASVSNVSFDSWNLTGDGDLIVSRSTLGRGNPTQRMR